MGPEALGHVLRPLKEIFRDGDYPDLLIGLENADDATVHRVSPDLALIQTVDFFPPIVDDPYAYGAIAAANALSDIYAMGGDVILALNVAEFPPDLPADYLSEIIRGGAEKIKEAGGIVAGGHTLTDQVPKFGFCITGHVHPDRIWTKSGALPGDALILTKPLGMGAILTAHKRRRAENGCVESAVVQMAQLNRWAAEALRTLGGQVHAVTDVTGFSLLGHGYEMASESRVSLRFDMARIPFAASAEEYARQGLYCSGTSRNEAYFGPHVRISPAVDQKAARLLFGSETSGGLFAAVAQDALPELAAAFGEVHQAYWIVGEVVAGEGIEVR